jgi:hypothetical protein
VEYEVIGEIFEWRGPAPFYFVALPEEYAREIDEVKQELTYGWGMITCKIVIDGMEYKTAITPKDGTYFVPLKDEIRKASLSFSWWASRANASTWLLGS